MLTARLVGHAIGSHDASLTDQARSGFGMLARCLDRIVGNADRARSGLRGAIGMQGVVGGGLLAAFIAKARRLGVGAGLAPAGVNASTGVERHFHRELGGVQGAAVGVIQRLCGEIGGRVDRAGIELVSERVERIVAAPHHVAHTDLR